MNKAVFTFLSVTLFVSSACVIAVVDSNSRGQYWPKGTFHRSLDLKPGGAIVLENNDGDIKVVGWERRTLEISAEGSPGSPPSAGFHVLGWRFSPPDVYVQGTGDLVRIRTNNSGHDREYDAVDFVLNVPHSVNLESIRNARGNINISDIYGRSLLDTDEGEINIRNYSGSLDVRLGKGAVEAELLDLRPQDSVRIKVERGDIVLLLEPAVGAQIIASAQEGNVLSEIELGQTLPAKMVTAKVGDGQASIELTTVRGDIKIRKVEEAQ